MNQDNNDKGSPLTVIVTALVALTVLSLLPWDEFTGHRLKNFSLISDLVPESDKTYITHEEIDPALAELDTAATAAAVPADTAADGASQLAFPAELPEDFTAPMTADSVVLIEDYSGGRYPAMLRSALAQAVTRPVRIAVTGDSYIEGDILTQDIRAGLQDRYGGSGVGYMAAYSAFPGFRQSVRQSGQGWTEHDMRKSASDQLKPLQGVYYTAGVGAEATFKGSHRPAHTDAWDRSTILYVAPADGTITVTTDAAADRVYPVTASTRLQQLTVDGHTTKFSFKTDVTGLKVAGVWLDSPTGVYVDCMSMRGNSGISHRGLDVETCTQMREFVPYDLIILEFGINALSSAQSDYSAYANAMVQAVDRIRAIYPDAVIMLMGIGDRGQKQNGTVGSLHTAPAMVRAQRDVARRTGSMFWDTRQAMGGSGSVVDWHRRGHVNADYIHLNHRGGKALADIFLTSLNRTLSEQ